MKLRTITTGISLQSIEQLGKIEQAVQFNQQAEDFFRQQGYEVQTTRIATNSWVDYIQDISQIQTIEQLCQSLNLKFINLGYGNNVEEIALIPEIIKNSSIVYCSSKIGDVKTGINFASLEASAAVIKRIAEITENGYGNFRFCGWANCPSGIPFFPAAYHEGEISFALGLEFPDLVIAAFSNSNSLTEAEDNLRNILNQELTKIEKLAKILSDNFQIKYQGIDASLAPSLDKKNSIVVAYESLNLGKFGEPGTLAISAMITRILKSLSVKLCGYSGLMLPVCEDIGLATRANEQTYNLSNLLLYSAVCGCGLDTVPLPGDISIQQLTAILLDLASLAIKLDKPLSARLFPIPGKKAGEMTNFNSPYLFDCKIL